MFATPARLAGGRLGFWSRSLEEFKRQARIAVNMEGLRRPDKPMYLIKFDDAASIERCKLMCDSDTGGFSRASLEFVSGSKPTAIPTTTPHIERSGTLTDLTSEPNHALFKGSISTKLPPSRPDIQRSGYAAWRTHDRGFSLFGKLLWDVDPYSFLGLKFKSDGRKYFVNIQTESLVPTDLHQHLLPCLTPGVWETAYIPLGAFVRTNYGMVVEPQNEMMRQKVRSIGIGSTDRVPGPFELKVAEIFVTNDATIVTQGTDSGFDVGHENDDLFDVSKKKVDEPEKILI